MSKTQRYCARLRMAHVLYNAQHFACLRKVKHTLAVRGSHTHSVGGNLPDESACTQAPSTQTSEPKRSTSKWHYTANRARRGPTVNHIGVCSARALAVGIACVAAPKCYKCGQSSLQRSQTRFGTEQGQKGQRSDDSERRQTQTTTVQQCSEYSYTVLSGHLADY